MLIAIIAGLFLSSLVYALATALSGRLAGLAIDCVTVGAGPRLAEGRIGTLPARLALVPITAGVTFAPDADGASRLDRLSLPASLLVQIAGPLAMLALAALLLGPYALNVAANVWTGVFALAGDSGKDVMLTAVNALQRAPLVEGIGLVAASNAAVQMLPFPPLTGGMMLMRLFGLKGETALAQTAFKIGFALCLALAAVAAVRLGSILTQSL